MYLKNSLKKYKKLVKLQGEIEPSLILKEDLVIYLINFTIKQKKK